MVRVGVRDSRSPGDLVGLDSGPVRLAVALTEPEGADVGGSAPPPAHAVSTNVPKRTATSRVIVAAPSPGLEDRWSSSTLFDI